MTTSSNQR